MTERDQLIRQMLGKLIHVVIDRPIGYDHNGLVYPVNYGYIPGLIAGDGEEQDVYILGVDIPLKEFEGIIIGAAVRKNDCEDKLIAAPDGVHLTRAQMEDAVHFQEKFFDTEIVLL